MPAAATTEENELLGKARRLLSIYEENELMVRAGLYSPGSDPDADAAIQIWPELDKYLARTETQDIGNSFTQLEVILRRSGQSGSRPQRRPAG